jgi:hypothetical protein
VINLGISNGPKYDKMGSAAPKSIHFVLDINGSSNNINNTSARGNRAESTHINTHSEDELALGKWTVGNT